MMGARLTQPQNAVRFEVETALEHGVTIACVRVNGAVLPSPGERVWLPYCTGKDKAT